MYQYTEFDRQFVQLRADQFRDQLTRWQAGTLKEDEFKPLRLQNGWYVQRYAPMLRVAVPYGELSSKQLRVLAKVAREYDQPDAQLLADAQATQDRLGPIPLANGQMIGSKLKFGYGHFTTRTNVQFNWIPLTKSADVMELLADVQLHASRPAATPSATSPATHWPALPKTRSPTRVRSARSCASGAHCTPSSRSCRASSRSRSTVPVKTAWHWAGTTWACSCCATMQANWAFVSTWAAAWAARRSSAPWCASSCRGTS